MKPHSERGVVLVITLVMLAVVTLMAVTFLALSRRERATVAVTEDQSTARLMADAGVGRATTEIIGRMILEGNPAAVEFTVSTNYFSPVGFRGGVTSITNVNYDYMAGGPNPPAGAEWLRNIANLQLDPRPPVFANPGATNQEFRFYLDLNRNGRFEPTGYYPQVDQNGRLLGDAGDLSYLSGDPHWIGVLPRPSEPHSATNRFLGRFAYVVLPAGRSLDINFIHNNANRRGNVPPTLTSLNYFRNHGLGSWELNLAAFLHDLNTNAWPTYNYLGAAVPLSTVSFDDALGFLKYRYGGGYAVTNLAPAENWFWRTVTNGTTTNLVNMAAYLEVDDLDQYCDGPAIGGSLWLTNDNDRTELPWVGSENTNAFFDLNEFFDARKVPLLWRNRLTNVQERGLATYDRYTFYRLLAQLGTDSAPVSRSRINLNYDNRPPLDATNMVEWTPVAFLQTVANRLFEATRTTNIVNRGGVLYTNFFIGDTLVRRSFSITNISLYPFNEYSPAVHRLIQVAANLYDATTNRGPSYPYFPTVFRPTFRGVGTNLYVDGYVEVTNTTFLNNLVPLDVPIIAQARTLAGRTNAEAVFYDVPFIIGAKKGYPNFNEVALQTAAQVTRRLEVRKLRENDRLPAQTNVMYQLTVSNQFGIEAWNSYATNFPRALRVQTAGRLDVMLTNAANPGSILRFAFTNYGTNLTLNGWPSNRFLVPLHRGMTVLSNELYVPSSPPAFVQSGTNVTFAQNLGFYLPDWQLRVTNRFYYALVDTAANRLVDFVCLGNLGAKLDLMREIGGRARLATVAGAAAEPPNVWLTNRVGGGANLATPTLGIVNQMEISLGNVEVSDQQWRSYSADTVQGRDKQKSIDWLRIFCGLSPQVYNTPQQVAELRAQFGGKLAYQAPYAPTRKVYLDASWQVNDPLVHYVAGDLLDPYNRPGDPDMTNSVRFAVPPQIRLTNENLEVLNKRYRPWGGNPNESNDPIGKDARYKDPMVRSSDDWDFPGQKLLNVGWMGRVHRGTPWQTLYLKSDLAHTNAWFRWAGNYGTHPTNDWLFADLFTVAPNDNASRGLLSVNQTNLAAWSAVFSGVPVFTNTTPLSGGRSDPLPTVTERIIEPDLPGRAQLRTLVEGINRTRQWETNRVPNGLGLPTFERAGRLLATRELTFASPFLNTNNVLNDAVLERLPQQVLSLIKEDEPRFVIYAFGQALREAPNSVHLANDDFYKLCTNYQVKAEFVSKTVLRLESPFTNPRAVVESYNELTTE